MLCFQPHHTSLHTKNIKVAAENMFEKVEKGEKKSMTVPWQP